MKKLRILIAILLPVAIFLACNKKDGGGTTTTSSTPNLPATPYNYVTAFPAYASAALTTNDNTPADNPITNDGATLGRVLFYDNALSFNNSISCASCHKPTQSFGDDAVKSAGFNGGSTRRHSMRLLNVRFYASGKMFWDERANTLEQQVLIPVQDATEMGMTLTELVSRISSKNFYPALFQKAFGTTEVTSDRIAKALAQFVRSIVTYQSKYDQVKSGTATFTALEQQGEQLFLTAGPAPCAGCHRPPMFLTSNPAGPFALPDANDQGINNQNRFKSGSLRNITTATSLFHNGSISNVNAMLNSQIPAHGIPPQDRNAILAFLQTLNDNTVTSDVRFSNPFKQ